MLKRIIFTSFCLLITMSIACTGSSEPNSNGAKTSTETKDLPKGIDPKPVQPDGKTTPGIPDPKNANLKELPKGTTPTPGIPDPKTIGKTPVPKGATPTPGIPSTEELKKMKERKVDMDEVNNPKTRKNGDKETTSPIDRKRRVDKP